MLCNNSTRDEESIQGMFKPLNVVCDHQVNLRLASILNQPALIPANMKGLWGFGGSVSFENFTRANFLVFTVQSQSAPLAMTVPSTVHCRVVMTLETF